MHKKSFKLVFGTAALSAALIIAAGLLCYPRRGGIPPAAEVDVPKNGSAYKGVDLNHASAGLLQCLDGIGEKRALAIIKYREDQNGFSSVGELLQVPGISEKLFRQIKEHTVVAKGAREYDAG